MSNEKAFRARDYIRDLERHKTNYFADSAAYPHVTRPGFFVDSSAAFYKRDDPRVRPTLDKHGFFSDMIFIQNRSVSEWAFSFICLAPGTTTGLGFVMLPEAQYGLRSPQDREDALHLIKDWMLKQYGDTILRAEAWDSCTGYYLWHHYAAEWGADSVGSEVGENIRHTQTSIAFTRGAGRQYGIPTWIDLSHWYNMNQRAHSCSLTLRMGLASYMGGMGFLMAEAGAYTMLSDEPEGDGYALNALGKTYKRIVDFANAYPDVGYAYTPFAVVLNYYHGLPPHNAFPKEVFGYFPFADADYMTWNLFDRFFPGSWEAPDNEGGFMVNSPYGDTCDALLQNAPQEVLNSYPCLILTGDITFSEEEAARCVNYIKQGGTLIMNTAYLAFFADYGAQYSGGVQTITDGEGAVIVYGPDFDVTALDGILREQYARLMPIAVSPPVEHLVNIKDGTMYVTLMNNDGFTKKATEEPVIDLSKTVDVTVTYTGEHTAFTVSEIFEKSSVCQNGNAVTVTVGPGECRVLEFRFD